MSSITVTLPDVFLAQIRELTSSEQTSVEQFAVSAIAEKLSRLAGVDDVSERAKRAQIHRFDALLAKIPDVEPEEYDRL
jgi:hypothetical protein